MKEYPIEGNKLAKFVRRGKDNFVIHDGKADIIDIPKAIGKKIWLCLHAQESLKGLDEADMFNWKITQKILAKLFLDSNCHGIVGWLMSNESAKAQGYRIEYGSTDEYMPMFSDTNFSEVLRRGRFPIYATSWTDDDYFCTDHSVAILGPTENTNEFIIFEKEGVAGYPFRMYVESREKIESTYTSFGSHGQ